MTSRPSVVTMEKLVALCKRRGFIFPGSEIYGGLANTWDYGPYGVELMNNVKQLWWKYFVHNREDIVGIDSAILMNPRVWEASGHVSSFADPLMDCKKCKERVRGDKLLEQKLGIENVAGKSLKQITDLMKAHKIVCPQCGAADFTEARSFNLMFKTYQGVIEEEAALVYLRPETAQGMFVNFKNVEQATRKKLPFGIAQIGKAFRNEITPGNFVYRTREFEIMEIEYFVQPGNWKPLYDGWRKEMEHFYLHMLGFSKDRMRWRQHEKDELSHYSKETWDIEYQFPFDWGEMWGIAYRTDYDLKRHQEFSGENLEYLDPETNVKSIPHCIEPTFGVARTVLIALLEAYDEDEAPSEKPGKGMEKRVVMRFLPNLAPIKAAVLPLLRKEQLTAIARELFEMLKKEFVVEYDENGSIGKRYRRQDEIGTPYCFTIDFQTLEDRTVTIRDRDSMKQERIPLKEVTEFLRRRV